MTVFLMVLSVSISVANSSFRKLFARDLLKTNSDNLAFTLGTQFLAMLIVLCTGNPFDAAPYTLLLAFLMGSVQVACSLSISRALVSGPVSLSTLLLQGLTLLVSSLLGPLFFSELLSLPQLLGIVLVLAAMFLIADVKKDKSISLRWLLLVIFSGVMGGMQGCFQKMLSRSAHAEQTAAFVFWTFAFSSMMTGLMLLINVKGERKDPVTFRLKGLALAALLVCSLSSGLLNIINLRLVASLPTAVFFPLNTCSIILLTAVAGLLFFREKMTRRQGCGFFLGIFAMMLTAGIFG